MSLDIRNSKIEDLEWDWIAHPRGDGDKTLIDRRGDIFVVGEIGDDSSCYSFDDWALVRLDDAFYLLNTSGCSCPSPCENWGVVEGPGTIDEIEAALFAKHGDWGMVVRQADEFRELFAAARAL